MDEIDWDETNTHINENWHMARSTNNLLMLLARVGIAKADIDYMDRTQGYYQSWENIEDCYVIRMRLRMNDITK